SHCAGDFRVTTEVGIRSYDKIVLNKTAHDFDKIGQTVCMDVGADELRLSCVDRRITIHRRIHGHIVAFVNTNTIIFEEAVADANVGMYDAHLAERSRYDRSMRGISAL